MSPSREIAQPSSEVPCHYTVGDDCTSTKNNREKKQETMESASEAQIQSFDFHVWHRRHTHDFGKPDLDRPGVGNGVVPPESNQSYTYEEDIADTTVADYDESRTAWTSISEKPLPDPPYHVFSRREKWALVYIVSLAGLFSPLSSNIYFPALGAIAEVRPIRTWEIYDILTGCNTGHRHQDRPRIVNCYHLHGGSGARAFVLGAPE